MDRSPKRSDTSLERWGWASICVNLVLIGINLWVAYASDSLAVAAETVHNTVDLVAAVAVLIGLKLSKRKSRNFPYGLYKVENVVAAGIALLVFLSAYEIVREALLTETKEITESIYIDFDEQGRLVSMTIEHAKDNAHLSEFSFIEMDSQVA